MDDVCTLVPTERIQDLLHRLNTIETSIQFTAVDLDGVLPFLDVCLSHDSDSTISTTVYRKSTSLK